MTKSRLILLAGSLVFAGCSGSRGIPLEDLTRPVLSCPNTPNCVSSQAIDTARQVKPLRYTSRLSDAREKLGSLGSSGVGVSCKNSKLQRMSRLVSARNQPLSRVLVEESLVNLGNGT
jgi:uncharacterized protein (DUF1499 family)